MQHVDLRGASASIRVSGPAREPIIQLPSRGAGDIVEILSDAEDEAMEFGIFNLMGSREADKPTAQVFGEVAEQTKLADELAQLGVTLVEVQVEPPGSPLAALLRIQQLARATALSAGTYRDEFAVLRQVVGAASDLFD